MTITNAFKRLEKMIDNINVKARIEKTIKSPSIFDARINDFQPLSQLLEERKKKKSSLMIMK